MNRRTFLKISAALGAASFLPQGGLSIASTFPLPCPHHYFPSAEQLLSARLARYDLLLVPAYAAAGLIRLGALHRLPGTPGRAHDPDGAFTLPALAAVAALVTRGPSTLTLSDLWTRPALWPDFPRLVIGAALLRRGHPPNDTHPGHLAQVEKDLSNLRPRLAPDPVAGLRADPSALALAPVPARIVEAEPGSSPGPQVWLSAPPIPNAHPHIPSEGAIWIEYDWVIPLDAPHPRAGLSFLAHAPRLPLHASRLPPSAPRPTPLTPLPPSVSAQYAQIWSRVKGGA
jgi:hypothetical protein